jgi:hypothetical protein
MKIMKESIELTKELHAKLNSEVVRYFLGTNEIVGNVIPRIMELLNNIEILCDKANQLDHLEFWGVKNWREYSWYSMNDDLF